MPKKLKVRDGRDADFLVCPLLSEPLIMRDNLIDLCSRCRRAIQHRPHVPDVTKICTECAIPILKKKDTQVTVTPKTVEELQDFYKKRQ